ncbi:hypothetical protein LguiB_017290 [Lonicera macranthoides]
MKHVPKQDENSIVLDSIGESDEEITNDKPLAVSRGSPQIDEWIICDFTRRRASVLARERIVSLPKKVGTLDDMPVRVPVRSGRYLYGETQGRMICVCHGRVWRGGM